MSPTSRLSMPLAALRYPVLAAALAVAACSSQQDDVVVPVIAPDTTSPGGIYIGQNNTQSGAAATTVIALVDQTKHLDLYSSDGGSLLSGLYTTTTTNGFSAQARSFALGGSSSSSGSSSSGSSSSSSGSSSGATAPTINLVGSFAAESQILASYTGTDGTGGSYNLAYQAALYQVPSTLATLAGTWVVQDAFGATITSFSIDAGGGVSGSTTAPVCTYNGNVSILDLRFNVYGLILNESCTSVGSSGGSTATTAALNGLATLLPASATLGSTQSQLVLTGASVSEGRLFRLTPLN